MSSRYRAPFRVGEIVKHTATGQVGVVKCVFPFMHRGQTVVVSMKDGANGMFALDVSRQMRDKMTVGPLERLGTPPRVRPGDWVIVEGSSEKCGVYTSGVNGSVVADCPEGSDVYRRTIQWPSWRKVKPNKGGLGKFRRGDLVTWPNRIGPVTIIDLAPTGLRCRVPVTNAVVELPKASFRELIRQRPVAPPTPEPTPKKEEIEPSSVLCVYSMQKILDGIVGFRSEKDIDKAMEALRGSLLAIAGLRPKTRWESDSGVDVNGHRFLVFDLLAMETA